MSVPELHILLSDAYTLSQHGKKAEAHTMIGRVLAENPEMLQCARTRCAEMAEVITARSSGGRVGCVITQAYHGLLTEALKGVADGAQG